MRALKQLFPFALVATFGLAPLAGCDDDQNDKMDFASADQAGADLAGADLAGSDMTVATIEFADFVISLINTQTSNNTLPTTTEDKVFTDSMSQAKFAVLFP